MTQAMQVLLDEARKLSPVEREQLAEMLLDTLPHDAAAHAVTDRAWADEADRRWHEHQASGQPAMDAFEALDEARARLRRGK